MPNLTIRTPQGLLDPRQRADLARAATAIAIKVEQGGEDPRQAALTWVLIEDYAPGGFFMGGAEPRAGLVPVVIFFDYPAGVLDDPARAEAARLLQDAVAAAAPAGAVVATSVIMREVGEGYWGGSGRIMRLADLAAAAGYKHLQHLVAA